MLVTELLGLRVQDDRGTALGVVVDCRFLLGGPLEGTATGPRLYGLIVNSRSRRPVFGYDRSRDDSPSLIGRFFRWRQRDSALLLWSDVTAITDEVVQVRGGAPRYDPTLP
jgi:hypothetical protein